MSDADTFVVMWRHRPGSRWQVQPFVHCSLVAERVAKKLTRSFKGEAWIIPVTLPVDEVPRDKEQITWADS